MSDSLQEPLERLKTYSEQLSLAKDVFDRGSVKGEPGFITEEKVFVKFSDGRRVKIINDIEKPREGLLVNVFTPAIYRKETPGSEISSVKGASPAEAADIIDEVHEQVGFFVDLTEEEAEVAADLQQKDHMGIREIEETLMSRRIHGGDKDLSHEEFLFALMVLHYRKAETAMVEEEPVHSDVTRSISRHLSDE